jgi:hypothetical protein
MTLDELTAAEMTQNASAAEIAETITANADKLDGIPTDETEALIQKMVDVAKKEKKTVHELNISKHAAFSYEDRLRCTVQIIERAERMLADSQPQSTKKKAAASTQRPIVKGEDGKYWIDAEGGTGPYDTKKEAEEDRRGLIRSAKLRDSEIVTSKDDRDAAKAKTKKAGKASGQKKSKASEPSPLDETQVSSDDTGSTDTNENPVNPTVSESETEMSTTAKKGRKANGTSAKATNGSKAPKAKGSKTTKAGKSGGDNGKPAKAPKAPKEPKVKKVGCLDAAYEVLKGRSKPMATTELVEVMAERKLWTSPGGKTPAQTLAAAMNREIDKKGKDSRFTKPEAGKFLANS